MRYLRKYLQQVGLVSTLLIGGVLGGLMAPLTSEAAPTVTLKVDNGAPVSILSTTNTSSTCTAAELTLGFTQCYAINTTLNVLGVPPTGTTLPVRSYLVRNAPGATARLRVADNPGQDKLSLIGVQFVPAPGTGQTVANWGNVSPTFANTNETHVLTITQSNTFDNSVGVQGDYVWAIRAGGEFRAGPTATGACAGNGTALGNCNPIGNSVTYPGTGTFNPTQGSTNILSTAAGSTVNTRTLSLTVAGPAVPIVSFDGLTNPTLGQVNPAYPTFLCDDNGTTAGGTCKPTITQTMTVTLKGPDSFVLVNGQDAFGANCTATLTATQQKQITFLTKLVNFLKWWESLHHSTRLEAFIALIEQYLATVNSNATGAGYDHIVGGCPGAKLVNLDVATAATADQIAFAASGAVSVEPAPQGTITINKSVCTVEFCTELTPVQFAFSIRKTSDNSLVTETNVTTNGAGHGSAVVSVPDGIYNVVESPQLGWNLTQASCGGGNTNGVTISAGGTVTCSFRNSPATGNDLGIRLTWGAAPTDLDSHLNIPNGNHVYFDNQGSLVVSPFADLDLDDVSSFGPENITVVKRMKGTYQYFVHNWSDRNNTEITNPMTNSPAKVELIRNGITTTYNPPTTPSEGTNRYWHVFNITVDSETCAVTIVPINTWLASPPAQITQTEELCP